MSKIVKNETNFTMVLFLKVEVKCTQFMPIHSFSFTIVGRVVISDGSWSLDE